MKRIDSLKSGKPKDNSFVQDIMEPVRKRAGLNESAFQSKWQQILEGFHAWQQGSYGSNTSQHNNQLDFLQRLCTAFPNADLLKDKQIAERILSEVRSVGEKFTGRKPNGETALLNVVSREITPRFGVNFILESEDGNRFTWEYFD